MSEQSQGAVRAEPHAPAARTEAPAIPFRRDPEVTRSAVGGGVGVLVLSLLAIVVVVVLRRRLNLHAGRPTNGRLLRVLESTRMGPRALLSVVEFDGTRYLIAQGEQGITTLAEKAAPPAPSEAP